MKISGLKTNAPKDEISGISEMHDIVLSYQSEAELFTVLQEEYHHSFVKLVGFPLMPNDKVHFIEIPLRSPFFR